MVRLSFIFLIVLLCGCRKDDVLQMSAKQYLGNSLRLSGYYYSQLNTKNTSIYFFYSNGYLLYAGDYPINTKFSEIELNIQSKDFNETIKKDKTLWSYFNIENQKIEFEVWSSGAKNELLVSSGLLMNDTTIIINKNTDRCGKEYTFNDTLKFRYFPIKPNSSSFFK